MLLTEEHLAEIAKNPNFEDKQLLRDLAELLKDKPEACEFLLLYGEYGETVDDLVDEVVTPEMVEKMDSLRLAVQSCAYWLKHSTYLWCVTELIHNTYFDSVKWESSEEEWKRRDAKCLSHCGYMMLFSIILIEFGRDKLKEFSLRFREHAHLRHINDPI